MSRSIRVAPVVAIVALLAGCGSADDTRAAPATASESARSPSAETVSELVVPTAPTGRCMPPNVDNLRSQDTAFEGTVTALTEETATLDVSRTYTGVPGDTVTVAVPGQDATGMLLAVDFEHGQTYLVSSTDGQVSVCGLSGPKDELLAGLYDEAYTG